MRICGSDRRVQRMAAFLIGRARVEFAASANQRQLLLNHQMFVANLLKRKSQRSVLSCILRFKGARIHDLPICIYFVVQKHRDIYAEERTIGKQMIRE